MPRRWFILLLSLVLILSACSGAANKDGLQIKEPWARAASAMLGHAQPSEMEQEGSGSKMTANGAAYMLIANQGETNDKLLGVTSDVAQFVEVHKTEMQDGVMRMQQVEFIEIPAKSQVELKPGGYHVMLIGLNRDLVPGDKIQLLLNFEKAGDISVEAEVRSP